MHTREAEAADAPAVAQLITLAYRVEDFFIDGDRTSTPDVLERMRSGTFLLLEDTAGLAGAVLVQARGATGYFGMLSVHPERQAQGLGGRLIAAAEEWCRQAGCREMQIEVVSLRTELPPYYARRGYVHRGERPFPDADKSRLPCVFLVMEKPL